MTEVMTNGSSVVCVLAEQSYFHGVAALANSLIHAGFAGQILVGYRGPLPAWAIAIRDRAQACDQEFGQVSENVTMRFVPIGLAPGGTNWNMSNMKPHFLRQAASVYSPDADSIFYFDVDIVTQCRWEHYRRWVKHGLVLVQDMAETAMPANHAYRHEWRALAGRAGYTCRDIIGYYNGGFLGVSRENVAFLDVWANLIELFAAEGSSDMARITSHGGPPEFIRMDQDILNIALMATQIPLAVLGREAMGCFPNQSIMLHAMVFRKPWQRNYIIDAIKGFPPDLAHMDFGGTPTGQSIPLPRTSYASSACKFAWRVISVWCGDAPLAIGETAPRFYESPRAGPVNIVSLSRRLPLPPT